MYNTLNRRGRAGNEYFSINDYTVRDGNVYIMNHDGKIVVYDPDLNLKESYQIPADNSFFRDFCLFDQNNLALSSLTRDTIVWQFYSKTQGKTFGSCLAMETLLNNSFILTRLGYIEQLDDPDDGTYRLSFYSLKDGHQRLINNKFVNGKWIIGLDYMDDTCIYSFENDYTYLSRLYEDSLLDEESRRILRTVNDDTNGLIIKYHLRNDIMTQ